MTDEQETPNDPNEEEQENDFNYDDTTDAVQELTTTTTVAPPSYDDDDYDDEPLPDVTVNLIINEAPDDLITAAVTDQYTQSVSSWTDAIDSYTSTLVNQLEGNGTTSEKQGWLGSWTWNKSFLVALIALCVIGILLALIFIIVGKKFKKTNSSQPTTTTKAVVTKGVKPDTKYSAVPTDV